jgi:hypothetical protein
MEPVTENPAVGATEVWEFYNTTGDAHPMHIHEIVFEVVNREDLVLDANGEVVEPIQLSGAVTPPESWETGFKDTVTAYPGTVTRVKAQFNNPGTFVWHCHIVEHEDNEMMRPFRVGPAVPGQPATKAATATLGVTPKTFELRQNYPNPFNPTTNIGFQLPKEVKVELKIYDQLGRLVRTLVDNKPYQAGAHLATWDGRNNRGRKVASGIYVYRIKAGSFTKSMKMNLIK